MRRLYERPFNLVLATYMRPWQLKRKRLSSNCLMLEPFRYPMILNLKIERKILPLTLCITTSCKRCLDFQFLAQSHMHESDSLHCDLVGIAVVAKYGRQFMWLVYCLSYQTGTCVLHLWHEKLSQKSHAMILCYLILILQHYARSVPLTDFINHDERQKLSNRNSNAKVKEFVFYRLLLQALWCAGVWQWVHLWLWLWERNTMMHQELLVVRIILSQICYKWWAEPPGLKSTTLAGEAIYT